MGRVDASGRVSDRTVMRALGWQAGDRLTVTAAGGVVIAHRDPAGLLGVTGSACLTIPAALRRRCGLEPGVRVLLTAAPARQVLAACSLAVVDEAIRAKVPALAADGGAP
jgi:bifunctional DNA-binding transcriptional regulator/antitoxin component of YhaV-PrlF toxin-antitoxin module